MMKNYSAALLLLGGTTLQQAALAQGTQAVRQPQQELAADGTPTFIHFGAGTRAYAATQARQAIIEQLGLKTDDNLQAVSAETDQLGFAHEKFQQYYKGIKVEHATYTAHALRGTLESLSGKFERVGGLNTTPSLNTKAALANALTFVGAKKYMWDADHNASLFPQGELVIVNKQRNLKKGEETGLPMLAYKFNVYAAQPISRAFIYVDAHSGEVIAKDDIIKHTAATGTFATAYSGTRSINDGTTTGGYFLREGITRGNGIETYNCKKGNSYTAAVDFIDADNNWTAAEYNNANFDNVAGDAQMGAQCTYDYWKAVHGRNSYDNAGAKIKSYVHFDDTPGDGVGYENAYWDGTEMTYGDGATRFRPLTALDVCGHEIGHAVCEKTANLTYSGESGAMNEGLSDIWGASIEAYSVASLGVISGGVKAKSTWLIGEEIDKQQVALRSMSDPKSLGQPAYYKGTNWYTGTADNGGVHTNSGVLNHWYYVLAAGESGTNEGGGTYSVASQGLDAAAKITFRMESVYMVASSTYAQARSYSIQAATDLYGAGSAQVTAVTNAWFAVGVGAAAGGTTPPPTGLAYCASKGTSQAYEYVRLVQLGTINRTSGADGGYYNGTATSTSVAAGSSQTISYQTGFTGSGYAEYFRIYADWNQNGVFTDAGENLVSSTNTAVVTGVRSATFTVPTTAKNGKTRLRLVMSDNSATNSCGSYSYGETEDYSVTVTGGTIAAPTTLTASAASGPATLSLYPNPATDRVRLSLSNGTNLTSVTVFDARGAAVSGARYADGELNVSSLAGGLYTILASDGRKTYNQHFVKQ